MEQEESKHEFNFEPTALADSVLFPVAQSTISSAKANPR